MVTANAATRHGRAAVVREKSGPFLIEEIGYAPPRAHEVVVRIIATGLCHTDLVIRDQMYPVPQPIVLGHEGAGVVVETGADVIAVEPGDHVVLSFLPCGSCRPCVEGAPAACENFFGCNFGGSRPDGSHVCSDAGGTPLHDRFFGQSSLAAFAVADARNVVKVRKDAPLELLGPLGCGIQTGAGAVLNALGVRPGDTFAAFGAGAVGLSAIMAAVVAGATTIVAVDVVPERLELARSLGATHVVNGRDEHAPDAIRDITGKGVDFTLDSTGIPAVLRQAVEALRPRGTCGFVGASALGTEVTFDVNDIMLNSKIVRGIIEGDSIPASFIPRMVDLYMQGRFPIDRLVRFYDLDEINEAARDSEEGRTIKPIIRMESAPAPTVAA